MGQVRVRVRSDSYQSYTKFGLRVFLLNVKMDVGWGVEVGILFFGVGMMSFFEGCGMWTLGDTRGHKWTQEDKNGFFEKKCVYLHRSLRRSGAVFEML